MNTKNKPHSPSPSVSEAYRKLEEALKSIDTQESWLQFLRFQARFRHYSINNVLLIYAQCPKATYICGYSTWQKMDRHVKKGEHALRILAPMTYKDKEDVKGEDHYRIRGFKLIPVFDLSQTAGSEEQLPILVTGLRDTVEGEDTLYRQVLRIIDIPVMEVEDLIAKGSYRIDPPEIQVRANLSVVQKIKTLCHEYGHHLHHVRCYAEESYDVGEVIAESAAFIVCCHLGLDTSEYSIPYLASWNQDLKAFQTVTRKIQQIASEMVTRIEDQASEAEFES